MDRPDTLAPEPDTRRAIPPGPPLLRPGPVPDATDPGPLDGSRADAPVGRSADLTPLVDALGTVVTENGAEYVATEQLHATLSRLRVEALRADLFLARGDAKSPPALALLRTLAGSGTLTDAVEMREHVVHPALYFLPIGVAWGSLGVMEHAFQESGRVDDQSFFSWWAGQQFGPSTFSALLAGVVVAIMVVEHRNRRATRRSQRAAERYDTAVAALTNRAVVVLENVDRRSRPDQSVEVLGRIADALVSPSSGADAIAAASSLTFSLAEIAAQMEAFDTSTRRLRDAAESMPEKVVGWTTELGALAGLPEAVRTSSATSLESSAAFERGTAALVDQLPQVAEVLELSLDLAARLTASEQAVAEAVGRARQSNEDADVARVRQASELEATADALKLVLAELITAAVEVRRAVALADALESLGEA